jgi:hypothetical protein
MAEDIRVLSVQANDLNAGTAKHLAKLLNEISRSPAKAKESRDRFILEFPDAESDSRPNYVVPEIREFVAVLDRECRHACYFLYGDPSLSQILFFLLCLTKIEENDGSWRYDSNNFLRAAQDRAALVAEFCRQIGEDEELGTEGILLNLPPEIITEQPQLAARVLRLMKPTLEALKRDFSDLRLRPDGREIIQHTLHRAALLSRFDATSRLDETLLDKILARLG